MSKIKEHKINKEDNMFIGGYYCPDSIIDPLLEWTDTFNLVGGTSYNANEKKVKTWDGEEKSHKECYQQSIVWPTCEEPRLVTFLDFVQASHNLYSERYSPLRGGGLYKMDPDFNFQKYPKGHAYNGWHCERGDHSTAKRMLVWMIYLNNCKDGGETAFLYQKYRVKPEKGLLLFWPSDFTHTHRGLSSYKTEKMIMTGWYSYVLGYGDSLAWQ